MDGTATVGKKPPSPRWGVGRGAVRHRSSGSPASTPGRAARSSSPIEGEGNQRPLPTVIRFALMGRPAVAEDAVRLRIGVLADRLDPSQPGGRESGEDEALQVELVMALAAESEEALGLRTGFGEAAEEAVVDAVGGAGDA